MAANTDLFVVASFALWAGDIRHMESLLQDTPPDRRTVRAVEFLEEPDEIVNLAAALRLRQLAQKRGEFSRISADLRSNDIVVSEEPLVLTTTHLRGTVRRTAQREFVLKGYLTDLDWEEQYFRMVDRQVNSQTTVGVQSIPDVEASTRDRVDRKIGGAWVLAGNPFVQVEVTDLGLIEANATWTEVQLPESFSQVQQAFQALLNSLDPPSASDDDTADR